MPLQNRVQPDGTIIATPARGLFMGNRGILHDADRMLGLARWRHPHWVTCVLDFKGRKRPLMALGNYTELFFLDEAVALAAGHRPCAECRRAEYMNFRSCWNAAFGVLPPRTDLDRAMHDSRVMRKTRSQRTHAADFDSLPDGSFVRHKDQACLVWGPQLWPCFPHGYGPPLHRPKTTTAEVLTPAVTVAISRAGYRPILHPSAQD
jgi:hypothetical protein